MTVTSLPRRLEGFVGSETSAGGASSRALGSWAGGVVAGVALLALAGWALDLAALKSVVPGLVSMNPLTAVCFVLAALSLLLLTVEPLPDRATMLSRLCAVVVVAAALLSFSRLYTPWDLAPDLVLFRDRVVIDNGGLPNRMAPTTGFTFILIGIALMLLEVRTERGRRPAVVLATVAGLLGLVVATGYAYESGGLYGIGRFVPMALNTAVCFSLLSAGIIAARPGTGFHSLLTQATPGGHLARRLLPAAIVLPVALGWLAFKGRQLGFFDHGGAAAVLATATMLIMAALVWRSAVRLDKSDRARGRAEEMLQELNEDLEGRVSQRTRELARINEALLDQTRFLHQVLDTSPQLVFVKDWAGRYTLANQALADLYGTTVDRLIGKTDADFHANAEAVRAVQLADRDVMTTRQMKVIAEDPATDELGMVRWFHTIKAPLVERDGTCNRMLGLCTDITARHFAEGELRRASDELRALFDASPLAMCGLTADGYVRSWNRAAEELFGWSAGEVVGRPLPIVPPQLQAEYRGLRDSMLSGNSVTTLETRRVRKDGEVIAVSVSTGPLYDASGRINGSVVVFGDIRDRKELEAQLRQAQKMEAVGQLAGGVAHDFNTLLTVIQTASELLLAEMEPGDRRRQDVQEIEGAASRAAILTRQLLAFSRQQVLEPRVVDLNRVVAEIEPMVRRLVQENITVVTRLADDLHPVTADPHQLDQVILNLAVNARDAMPEGGTLLIETANVLLDENFPRTHPSAHPGPHVMLSVTDTGCGMDDATQARIFEPFFTTKPVGVGTGLGLATVYGIVKQSGGHIWVYSEVGRGSSFKIYLPVSPVSETGSEPAPAAPPRRADVAGGRGGATILVVEDDAAVRCAVRRVLERRGYDVLESWNGDHALAALARARGSVDLVISDIVMPEMSGLELRDRMKEIQPAVPVLLMSGYSQEAITRLGNHESLGPLIEKPFTVDGLLENVRSVLRG